MVQLEYESEGIPYCECRWQLEHFEKILLIVMILILQLLGIIPVKRVQCSS